MRFDLPEEKKLVHEMVIPMRWGDMDAMGHVNNTIYFRYMEMVRLEWLFIAGGAKDEHGNGPVMVNAFCNFIKQLQYPGNLRAKLYVANPGRTSFDTYVTLERADAPGEICASGGAKTVWINYAQEKSVLLPDSVRALIVQLDITEAIPGPATGPFAKS